MILRKDIDAFIKTINKNITLIAATKYVDPLIMEQLLTKGINNFGENRVDYYFNMLVIIRMILLLNMSL